MPPKKLLEEAQEVLVACRLADKAPEECRRQFGNSTAMPPPDKVKERFEMEKGAPRAILGTLENCTEDIGKAGLSVTFEDCKMQVKAMLEKLKNETVPAEELDRQIRKIAEEKAKHIISTCSKAASTDAAKEACLSSAEALEALAKLSGRAVGSVPEEELRRLFRRGAAEEISEGLRLCMGSADTDAKERECFGSDDIRATIGESMGKGGDHVKDSDIREFLEEGVKEEIWTMLEACPEDSQERCMDAAKDMLAAVSGQESSAITGDMVRKLLKDEMASELGERMRACMGTAEDNTAKERCRTTLSADVLGVAGRGGAPSRTDVGEALMEAGRDKAKEVSKDCQGTREECMEKLRDEAAKSMGRLKEDLSEMEVERLNMDGARDAAKEAARGCAAARKESASATCADPTEVFASARRVPIEDDVDRKRIRQELVKETEKDAMRTCMDESDKQGFDRCMGEIKDGDEVAGELFKGLSDERKQSKEKRARDEAAIEVVGERFQICMESSTTPEEKQACKAEVRDGAGMAGLAEDVEDVVKRYHRNVVATAARACNQTARKTCIDRAKEELMKSGLEERAFHVVRQLAEMKSAAEVWAACQEDSAEVNATCDALAQAELEEISGSTSVWTAEVAEKVKALGEAMLEGREIVLRKLQAILLEVLTDALDCSDAVLDKLAQKAQQTSDGFMPNASMGPRNVSHKECRIVWGLARYFCKVHTKDLNETETDDLSETLSTDLGTTDISVRRLGRRLAVITESYAAQEEEETISTSGGSDDDTGDDADDGGDPTSTSHGLSTAAYSASTALLSLLFLS
ncbi:gcy-35 [Symbiodinium natans]|uniref:Gcy-35 protein n=1 Tax=Symbiodinium natans TaxID=878477 RepID=A0A812MUD6_9DINO|nr:gcy-35 [Symbiodinium natans]